jgi:hypothetical protein
MNFDRQQTGNTASCNPGIRPAQAAARVERFMSRAFCLDMHWTIDRRPEMCLQGRGIVIFWAHFIAETAVVCVSR